MIKNHNKFPQQHFLVSGQDDTLLGRLAIRYSRWTKKLKLTHAPTTRLVGHLYRSPNSDNDGGGIFISTLILNLVANLFNFYLLRTMADCDCVPQIRCDLIQRASVSKYFYCYESEPETENVPPSLEYA